VLMLPASHRAVETFLHDILALTGASGGVIRAKSPTGGEIGLVAAAGLTEAAIHHEAINPICGVCAETLASDCVTTNSENCPIARGELAGSASTSSHPWPVAVPIDYHGQSVGVLTLFFPTPPTTNNWMPLLRPLGLLLGLALENLRLEQEQAQLWAMRLQHLLAAELHDGLAQRLTYARMTVNLLQQLLRFIPTPSDDAEPHVTIRTKMGELDQSLKAAQQEVRSLIQQFGSNHPSSQPDWEGLFRDFQSACPQTRLQVTLNPAQLSNDPLRCEQLYRIVQEALHNIRKHADARHVAITLERTAGGLQLTICDDGKGFIANEPASASFGLKLMKERVALLNGTLTIDSSPGEGTTVQVTLPFVHSGGQP